MMQNLAAIARKEWKSELMGTVKGLYWMMQDLQDIYIKEIEGQRSDESVIGAYVSIVDDAKKSLNYLKEELDTKRCIDTKVFSEGIHSLYRAARGVQIQTYK
jgi:hypothetical protein